MSTDEKLADVVLKLSTADTTVDKLLKENKGYSFFAPYKSAQSAGKAIKEALVVLKNETLSLEDKVAKVVPTLTPADKIVDELLAKYKSMSSQQLYKDAAVAGTAVKEALELLK